jgi:hypothetical protein
MKKLLLGTVLCLCSCAGMAQRKEFVTAQLDKLRSYRDWEVGARQSLPDACKPSFLEQRKRLTEIIHDQGLFILGHEPEKKP